MAASTHSSHHHRTHLTVVTPQKAPRTIPISLNSSTLHEATKKPNAGGSNHQNYHRRPPLLPVHFDHKPPYAKDSPDPDLPTTTKSPPSSSASSPLHPKTRSLHCLNSIKATADPPRKHLEAPFQCAAPSHAWNLHRRNYYAPKPRARLPKLHRENLNSSDENQGTTTCRSSMTMQSNRNKIKFARPIRSKRRLKL